MPIEVGGYVEILEEPEGYHVPIGTIGKVQGNRWLVVQGIYNIDVFDPEAEGCVNLTFEPCRIRGVTPDEIAASPDWKIQKVMLDEYENVMKIKGVR